MKLKKMMIALVGLAGIEASSHAVAEIVITQTPGPQILTQRIWDPVNIGWNVIIQARGNPSMGLTVSSTLPGGRVLSIVVTPMDPTPVLPADHLITLTVNTAIGPGSIAYIGDIRNSEPTQGQLALGLIQVTGTAGNPASPNSTSIVAQRIGRIIAPIGIGSEVRALGSVGGPAGEITELLSTGGSITGNISAALGIQRITCESGTLGPASGLSTIQITGSSDTFDIGRIRAKSIRADIDTVSGGSGSFARVAQITTLGPAAAGGVGEFTVSLRTANLGLLYPGNFTAFMDIAGNLNADVTFLYTLAALEGLAFPAAINIGGELPANKTIRVGLSMEGGNTGVGGIKVTAAGGLKGQVMVNAQNGNPATYPWLGDVIVGSTLLDPGTTGSSPHYSTLSSTLGGGAVGKSSSISTRKTVSP